jgi:hypothetical protein
LLAADAEVLETPGKRTRPGNERGELMKDDAHAVLDVQPR